MISYDKAYLPEPIHSFPGELWNYRRVISMNDCPHLQSPSRRRERENLEKKFGRNSAYVKSMVYGEFQATIDGNAVFDELTIGLLRDAMLGNSTPISGDIRASGDVSGGGDRQILMVREGTEIVYVDKAQHPTEIEMAEHWVRVLTGLGIYPHQFWIDGGGIGAPVANYMELRLGYSGINRFMANNSPTYDTEFKDRYTELHWWVKELLQYKVLKFTRMETDLLDDCKFRMYIELNDGKIKTEPKEDHRKRVKRSPDFLDTLVYLLADFNMDAIRRGKKIERMAALPANPNEPSKLEVEAARAALGGGAFGDMRRMPNFALHRIRT